MFEPMGLFPTVFAFNVNHDWGTGDAHFPGLLSTLVGIAPNAGPPALKYITLADSQFLDDCPSLKPPFVGDFQLLYV